MATDPNADERRRKLARLDFEASDGMQVKELAAMLGVSTGLISQDRSTEAYRQEKDKFERQPRIRRIKKLAWELIEGVIQDGCNARKTEPDISEFGTNDRGSGSAISATINAHQGTIERGNRTAMWFFEKIGELTSGEGGEQSEAMQLMTQIFGSGAEQLRTENAALKQRLAAIEARVSALNGQGGDILNDPEIPKIPQSEESDVVEAQGAQCDPD